MTAIPFGLTASSHFSAAPSASGSGTAVAAPAGAKGVLLTVAAQAAYLTLDGSAPTATNGLTLPAAAVPVFIPCGKSLTLLAAVAGSVINGIWLK